MKKTKIQLTLQNILAVTFFFAACQSLPQHVPAKTPKFNAERALKDLEYQVDLGPRAPATSGHAQIVPWLEDELTQAGWEVTLQKDVRMGHPIVNVIAKREQGRGAPILLGTHYDTRIYADQESIAENRTKPVPGANDGASGVAVLLELSRVLPKDIATNLWLVFFDLEDNGQIPGWDWILGSRSFVDTLDQHPQAVIIVDMVGDRDLNIHHEQSSTLSLRNEIWNQAEELGYASYFIPTPKYSILDDHTPFLEAGIPAVNIIDFDYPYWHTTEDTIDKVSAHSLQVVGDTLLAWLLSK